MEPTIENGALVDRAPGQVSSVISALVVARVLRHGGEAAVAELLLRSASPHSAAELTDPARWIAAAEAAALLRAGTAVTHDPDFARAIGADAASALRDGAAAAGIPTRGQDGHDLYTKLPRLLEGLTTATRLTIAGLGEDEAELIAQVGDAASAEGCAWTQGLIGAVPAIAGASAAAVEHRECEALGAERCVYRVHWERSESAAAELAEERRLHENSRHLLDLARELATVGPSDEVALRFVDAVRLVVDCDEVRVLLWDLSRGELVQRAVSGVHAHENELGLELTVALEGDGRLEELLSVSRSEPIFVPAAGGDDGHLSAMLEDPSLGGMAIVPLLAPDAFLGVVVFTVSEQPERLAATLDLIDRLSEVGAQASIAFQNGRLVDAFALHALRDSLTGLANRLQFHESLRLAVDRAIAADGSIGLFYIDLDGFKPINDRWGHDVGDELLTAVGRRLQQCTRSVDTVGRLGGDEFAVLVENSAGVDHLARRLAAAFDRPFQVGDRKLRIAASIGCAQLPEEAQSAEDLLRAADAAMYQVKQARTAAAHPGDLAPSGS